MTAPAAPLYICTKCGRPSRTAKHDGCNYLATLCEETPAAPLDRAVEEARKALAFHARTGCCRCDACAAITALLAALDADKRLEEAEEALATVAHLCGSNPDYYTREAKAVARRYFARREEKEVPK